jgi:hypothetical protein
MRVLDLPNMDELEARQFRREFKAALQQEPVRR